MGISSPGKELPQTLRRRTEYPCGQCQHPSAKSKIFWGSRVTGGLSKTSPPLLVLFTASRCLLSGQTTARRPSVNYAGVCAQPQSWLSQIFHAWTRMRVMLALGQSCLRWMRNDRKGDRLWEQGPDKDREEILCHKAGASGGSRVHLTVPSLLSGTEVHRSYSLGCGISETQSGRSQGGLNVSRNWSLTSSTG